jgi:hypothetical protein
MLTQEKKRGVVHHTGIRLFNVQKPDRWVGSSCMFKLLMALMTYNISDQLQRTCIAGVCV